MKPAFFRIRIELQEDLHTGSGTGSGDTDALVTRDRRGRPVIRSTHVTGVLRELWREQENLRLGTSRDLDGLFGYGAGQKNETVGRGRLTLGSFRVPPGAGFSFLNWQSTARAVDGRQAREDTLRSIEFVASGTRFEAHGMIERDEPKIRDLFSRLIQRLDRIGAGRTRGPALVRTELEWLAEAPSKQGVAKVVGEPRCGIRLQLKNVEPLNLPATAVPGNLIPTNSFIRGQTLAGAIVAWSIRRGFAPAFDWLGSIGDALPLPDGLTRAAQVLPVPLSLLTSKPAAADGLKPWWAGTDQADMFDAICSDRRAGAEKPKRPGEHEYIAREKATDPWTRFTPSMGVSLRNQTPDRRSGHADPILFSQGEVSEETVFQADAWFSSPEEAAAFADRLRPLIGGGDWLTVGRAGRPVIVTGAEYFDPDVKPGKDAEFVLTLKSDLIARGPLLGFETGLTPALLSDLLGTSEPLSISLEKQYTDEERIDGFNGVSGRHRARAVAIRRGSCWKVSGRDAGRLQSALATRAALGERTDEGFGRFELAVQPLGSVIRQAPLRSVARENQLETIRRIAQRIAADPKACKPSRSQLQDLKSAALSVSSSEELEKVLEAFRTAPERRPRGAAAWKDFPFAQIEKAFRDLGVDTLAARRDLLNWAVRYAVANQETRVTVLSEVVDERRNGPD